MSTPIARLATAACALMILGCSDDSPIAPTPEPPLVSTSAHDWFWASRPVSIDEAHPYRKARGDVLWYNPVVSPVRHSDIYPETISPAASQPVPVLMLRLSPNDSVSTWASGSAQWFGVAQGLSASGVDLSDRQFVEVWLNDFREAGARDVHAEMVIDLGIISEDAVWSPVTTEISNNERDLEDQNFDGILGLDESENGLYEDTGFDGRRSDEELGYDPVSLPDPNSDDFDFDRELATDAFNYEAYVKVNRLEDNRRLDDEDINGDNIFQVRTGNNYLECRADLSDSVGVAVDVHRDFGVDTDANGMPNGWRLFRLPIATGTPHGSPNLAVARHVRIWFTGFNGPVTLQIASVEVVSE